MKVISYNPHEIDNIPQFLNKSIDENQNEEYIMFIFNDILDALIDVNDFSSKYETLMRKLDLPFAFYPYYIHFNKVLKDSISKPNPRAHIGMDDGYIFDIVSNPAYGVLVLDIKALKKINFKFNESYKIAFYVQDLIAKCHAEKLTLSSTNFIDVFESYKCFKTNLVTGFEIDQKIFTEEKDKFYASNQLQGEKINDFIKSLKDKYGSTPQGN